MSHAITVAQLRQKIDRMQAPKLVSDALPTDQALAELFAGGSLRRGRTYAVEGSLQLALTLIAEASRSGVWCGIVGLPHFGIEAAQDLGIRLDRLVHIAAPHERMFAAVTSLTEVLGAIIVGPLALQPQQQDRLASRLREHRSTLITAVPPTAAGLHGIESQLTVESSRWSGLAEGFGMLRTRELTVRSRDRTRTRLCTLRFDHQKVQCVSPKRTENLRAVRG